MNRASYVAERLYQVLRIRGTRVTIRTPSVVPGSAPQPNPPRATALRLGVDAIQGATTITVTADQLSGRFVAGDRLTLGNQVLTVQSTATASGNSASVAVSPGLAEARSMGAAITPTWSADRTVPAAVAGYARRLVDGTLIEARDFAVTVSSHNLGATPTLQDTLILASGEVRRIVTVTPQLVQGEPSGYLLQAR